VALIDWCGVNFSRHQEAIPEIVDAVVLQEFFVSQLIEILFGYGLNARLAQQWFVLFQL